MLGNIDWINFRGWRVELTVGGNNCQGGILTNPTKITLETSLTK